ncbi:MAG: stage III sporulation protein AA [Oscillospiraceae bacterium]|nr:stage III sporulation protein AA [Oscillospiraceae bacterium]
MTATENLRTVLPYLPGSVRHSLEQMSGENRSRIREVRLRSGRPAAVDLGGREYLLTPDGGTTVLPEAALTVSREDLARSLQAVCAYSVYSHEQELTQGYVTVRGGCRVGICGSVQRQGDRVQSLRQVGSMNFRIAGEYPGVAERAFGRMGGTRAGGILIAGNVGSGKTTFLRDLCRLLGNRCRTALVDERGEIAACVQGVPQCDVGLHTDVLDGYPREEGILTAVRVLTPAYVLCDEIGTQADAQALLHAAGCGVQLAATCHAGSFEELQRRSVIASLLDRGVFRHLVELSAAGAPENVRMLRS